MSSLRNSGLFIIHGFIIENVCDCEQQSMDLALQRCRTDLLDDSEVKRLELKSTRRGRKSTSAVLVSTEGVPLGSFWLFIYY